jgi:Lar family restriction alleviation protein
MTDNLPPLLPCPFCGRSDLLGFEFVENGFTAVSCRACGARNGGNRAETNKDASLYWNRRAAVESALRAAVPDGLKWPTMPKSQGQSNVLFDDGYEEGWSRCFEECRQMLEASPQAPQAAQPVQPSDFSIRPDGKGGTGIFYEPVVQQAGAVLKPEPVAYLYHDAPSAEQASSILSSTLIVLAADRRPTFRNETPLYLHPPQSEQVRKPLSEARPLTTRELAEVTAPWSDVWTDKSFGIANAAIAKFCEVNGIEAAHNIREN